MLVFLPFLAWFVTVFIWLGGPQNEKGGNSTFHSIRSALIFATICCGAYLAITTELLSLIHALTKVWVGVTWGIALIVLGVIDIYKRFIRRGLLRIYTGWLSMHKSDLFVGGLLALLSSALLTIIIISPSGNTDSMLYHLSRVVHWAQDASLQHYATAVVQQLYNPIWAEEAILHLRLLLGSDRLAGLVQWGSMLGSIVVITKISSELRVGRIGQWIAAAFAFSIPMGILQSVSPQNDYAVAFWLVCLAWLCVRATKYEFTYLESLLFGLTLSLGLLTKGTFYPYAIPFVLWFVIASILRTIRQSDRKNALKRISFSFSIIFLTVIILNIGYWSRNIYTFGSPLGPSEWVSAMTAGQYSVGALLASLLRNIAMNFASPSEKFNSWLTQVLQSKLTPLDPRMVDFRLIWGWNHEDTAGNPLHVILLLFSSLGLFTTWKRIKDKRIWIYMTATLAAFIMLALIVHFDNYGIRYQLPLFVLAAPIFGVVADLLFTKSNPDLATSVSHDTFIQRIWNFRLWGVTLLLFLAALPWILINRTHPLLALKNGGEPFSIPCLPMLGCTVGSILFEPPTTSLFANYIQLRGPYSQVSDDILKSRCQQIGLRIDSHDPEYIFWWLLKAPQSGMRLETLYTFPELERYIDPSFHPCAIICTICNDRTRLHGLNLTSDYSGIKLFTGGEYNPDPGPKN